ncbi:MAG: protein kinase, partial [Chloroflexi bacterium]|nr:protein kinase [Chloroflexota bacterium]
MSTIKGYVLHEKVGSGLFGDVFRATSPPPLNAEVAIKQIHSEHVNRPEFIRRFESEATIVASLQGPFITPVIHYWRDHDGAYIVMWYMKGGSLKDALKDGPFDVHNAARLIDQICIALTKAHRHAVIHRDVKPANILFDEDGNAYLSDFNIAKNLAQAGGITELGEFVGTWDYSAPEQIRGDTVGPPTDVYSLGVILYEMLQGEHRFPNLNLNPVEVIYKSLNDPVPLLDHLDEHIIDAVNQVIQTATAKDPLKRYPTAADFASAFREAIAPIAKDSEQDEMVMLLTRREQEVIKLIVEGKSNAEIARELFLALSTVKGYLNNIYKKLNVRNRIELIVKARQMKLVVEGETPRDGNGHTPDTYIYLEAPDNPYKGLDAFTLADERDFFGRDAIRDKLLARMQDDGPYSRFLAIVGPSGSGKSSLVKAGIMPAIYRQRLPGLTNWYMVDFIPGNRPLDKLEVALQKVASDESSVIPDHLRRDEFGLVRVADLIMPDDEGDLLIIIDQFEEVFTLLEDEEDRQHFLNLIYHAVTEPRSRIRILVTLRADFYDRPLQYPGIGDLMRDRMETILPLSAEELEQAIVKPAEKVHVRYEEGLVTRIISDINYQPGALPLLQFALTQLFDERDNRTITNETYQRVGGAIGALAKRADDLFLSLTEEGQAALHQTFLRLVTLGEGTGDTRRRVSRQELLSITFDADLMDDVIDVFATDRLLSLDHDTTTKMPTVEVAHEALLREWERLRAWLNESREEIKLQRRLGEAAESWAQNHREASYLLRGARLGRYESWAKETSLALTPLETEFLAASLAERNRQETAEQKRQAYERQLEKRSIRVLRTLVGVLLVASFFGILLTLALFYQGRVAASERDTAQLERNRAEEQSQIAEAERDTAQQERNRAEEQRKLAFARELAAASISNIDIDPERSVLLALHSLEQTYTVEAENALHRAVPELHIIRTLEGCPSIVFDVDYSPDGTLIAGACWDGTVRIWDASTGQQLPPLTGHTDKVHCVAFSPDGKWLVSGSYDATAKVWDASTGKLIHTLVGHQPLREGWEQGVLSVAFSPDGRLIATGGSDHTARIWDVNTGDQIMVFSDHTADIEAVVFSPDGQHLATGDRGGSSIRVWNITSEDLLLKHQVGSLDRNNHTYVVAFHPDGTRLAGGTGTGDLRVIDSSSGELVLDLRNTSGGLWRAKYSPDGQWLATGGWDGRARIWDARNGKQLLVLASHTSAVLSLDFSPDGTRLVTSSGDHTIKLWDLAPGQELFAIQDVAGFAVEYHPSEPSFFTSEFVLRNGETQSLILVRHESDHEQTTTIGSDVF